MSVAENKSGTTLYFQNALGVFQGGGCRGAAYVGAFAEATSRGVHFSEVAGSSAGSIVAALIGAGARPSEIERSLLKFDYSRLQEWIWRPRLMKVAQLFPGIIPQLVSVYKVRAIYKSRYIEDFLEEELSNLLGKKGVCFKDLVIPTHVISTDLKFRNVKVWSSSGTPEDLVARAVRASCALPFYFDSVDDRYVDGGLLSNLPAFVFSGERHPAARRVLAFSLQSDQGNGASFSSLLTYAKAVADTVVDGSVAIQDGLFTVSKVNIGTGDLEATDFAKINHERNCDLITRGRRCTAEFFDKERIHFKSPVVRSNILPGEDEARTAITDHLKDDDLVEIAITDADSDFVYKIFPSLAHWLLHGVRLKVLLPKSLGSNEKSIQTEKYRRKLLMLLGADCSEVDQLPGFRGFIFSHHDGEFSAVIRSFKPELKEAVHYEGVMDQPAISAMIGQFSKYFEPAEEATSCVPKLGVADLGLLLSRLGTIKQYRSAKLELEEVSLDDILSITPFVHEFKYRQIPALLKMYEDAGVRPFAPIQIGLANGRGTIFTPPVLEEVQPGKFVLIEGTTRATWLRKNGAATVLAVVVRGVTAQLPGEMTDLDRVRIVYNSVRDVGRYGAAFDYNLFRHIENAVHLLEDVGL